MADEKLLHVALTERIIKAFFHVCNMLGYGFLERVYENALAHTLQKMGCEVRTQVPMSVHFEGVIVGECFADIVVENCVVLELKAAESIHESHESQLLNYLRASDIEVGLLLNFGKKPEFKRKAFSNSRKPHGTQT